MSARHAVEMSFAKKVRHLWWVPGVLVVAAVLVTGYVVTHPEAEAPAATPNGPTVEIPDGQPISFPTYPDVPETTPQDELAALPFADTWGVIPALLDQTAIEDEIDDDLYEIASPTAELTALYAEQDTEAEPVAALGYYAVEDRTTLAVFAHQGAWLLVGTPARIFVPTLDDPDTKDVDEAVTAPTVSFAWARATDFVLDEVDRRIVVDNATSTISLLDRDGTVLMHEQVKLGGDGEPTPSDTLGYIVATYTDAEKQKWTGGYPIGLVNSHSATMPTYGADPAPTGIHYSSSTTKNSKGCVRVSTAFSQALEPLLGVRVYFT